MSKDSSAKYYKKDKENLRKDTHKRYQDLPKEEKNKKGYDGHT